MDDKKAIEDSLAKDAITALVLQARKDGIGVTDMLWAAGYRLDPYPNGKSKSELIARIETVEAERDKTRNLLRSEHDQFIDKSYEGTPLTKRNLHAFANPDCPVCTFLAETSSVKL